MSARWIDVDCPVGLAPGEAAVARAGYQEFAVANVDGKLYAISNRCPHQGGDLGEGYLEGACLSCPLHGWAFDVRTGAAAYENQPGKLRTYPVKLQDGKVWIEVEEE